MPGPSSPTYHNHHHQSLMNDAACSRLAVLVAAKSHPTQRHQSTASASAGGLTNSGSLILYSVNHQPQSAQAVSITPIHSVLAPSTSSASSFKAREAVWSADGRHYATTGLISQSSSSSSSTSSSTVSIHDAVTSKIVEIVPLPPSSDKSSIFGAIAFGTRKSSRSLYLAVGGNTQKWQVHVWDRKDRKYTLTFSPHTAAISCLAVNQDEMFVMSGSINGDLKVHSLRTNTPLHLQSPFSQTVNTCAFSPFKRTLAAAVGDDGILALYDVNTTSLTPVFVLRDAHHAPIHGLAWSPCNSSLLATAGLDSRVRLYSKDEKWRCIWEAQTDAPATSVSMDDTFLLVYGTLSGQVAVHDTRHRNTAPLDIMDLNSAITKTVFEPAKWVKDSAAKDIGVAITGPTTSVSGGGHAGSRPITPPPPSSSAVSAKAGSNKPASSPVVAAFKERVANLKAKAAAQNATAGGGGGAALDLFSPVTKPVATGQDKFANLNARVKELREQQQKKTNQIAPGTVGDKMSATGGGVGGMTIAKPAADLKVQRNTMMDLFSPVTAGGRVQTTAPKTAAPTMPAFQEVETKPDPPKTPPTQRQAHQRPPVAGPVSQSAMRPSSPTPSPVAAKPFTMASTSEFFETTLIPFQDESPPSGVASLTQPPLLAQRTLSAGATGSTKSTPAGTGNDAMSRMQGALSVLRSGKSGTSTPASVTGAAGPALAISGADQHDRLVSGSFAGRRAVSFDINRISDGVSGVKKAPVGVGRRVVSAAASGSVKAHHLKVQDVSESRLEDVDMDDGVDDIAAFKVDVPGSVMDAANAAVQSVSAKAEKIGLETVEVLVDSGVDPGLWELAANDEGPSSTAIHEWLPDEEEGTKLAGELEGMYGLMADDAGQSALTTGGGSVSMIQRQILEGVMEECLAGFRAEMKEDIRNMHLEMLRQFHVQKNEIEMMLKKHSPTEALLREVKQLREENARLRCGY